MALPFLRIKLSKNQTPKAPEILETGYMISNLSARQLVDVLAKDIKSN